MRYRLSLPAPQTHHLADSRPSLGSSRTHRGPLLAGLDARQLPRSASTPGTSRGSATGRRTAGPSRCGGWTSTGPPSRRGAAEAVLRWRVYANELSVRTSHLDGTHGYSTAPRSSSTRPRRWRSRPTAGGGRRRRAGEVASHCRAGPGTSRRLTTTSWSTSPSRSAATGSSGSPRAANRTSWRSGGGPTGTAGSSRPAADRRGLGGDLRGAAATSATSSSSTSPTGARAGSSTRPPPRCSIPRTGFPGEGYEDS